MTMSDSMIVFSHERSTPGKGLEQHHAKRVNIRSSVYRSPHALLRRHIFGCPYACSRAGQPFIPLKHFCYAEIREDRPARAVHQDIDRLDIAMNDTLLVRVCQGARKLLKYTVGLQQIHKGHIRPTGKM